MKQAPFRSVGAQVTVDPEVQAAKPSDRAVARLNKRNAKTSAKAARHWQRQGFKAKSLRVPRQRLIIYSYDKSERVVTHQPGTGGEKKGLMPHHPLCRCRRSAGGIVDGRHYVVAALAIAVSIPSGKTTATRSVRPSTKAPQPANHVVRLRPELAMCDRKAPWPQDGISVRRRSRIMGKKISDARKGAASGFLACRLVLQLISNLRQACPSCLSSYAIDPACQVGAMLHVWTGVSCDRYSITSVENARSVRDMLRSIALTVLRLSTISNLVGN